MRLQRLLFTFVVKKWIYLRVYVLLWWLLTGAGEEKCLMERKGGKEEREPEFLVSADLSQRLTWVQTRRHTHAVCVSLLTSSPQMTVYLKWSCCQNVVTGGEHNIKRLPVLMNNLMWLRHKCSCFNVLFTCHSQISFLTVWLSQRLLQQGTKWNEPLPWVNVVISLVLIIVGNI